MVLSLDSSSQTLLLPRKYLKTVGGEGHGLWEEQGRQGWGWGGRWDHPGPSPALPLPHSSRGPAPLSSCSHHGPPLKCATLLSLDTNLSLQPSHTGSNFPTKTVLNPKEREGGGGRKINMKISEKQIQTPEDQWCSARTGAWSYNNTSTSTCARIFPIKLESRARPKGSTTSQGEPMLICRLLLSHLYC